MLRLTETQFHTLIYGCGNKIVHIEMFSLQYPVQGRVHEFYYFGDLDYEGIRIWHQLAKKKTIFPALPFYLACLQKEPGKDRVHQQPDQMALAAFLKYFASSGASEAGAAIGSRGLLASRNIILRGTGPNLEGTRVDELRNAGIQQITQGFAERMMKVALFDPLFELQRKKQTDLQGQPIDMMELGMLSLLYFFEQKLMRNHKAGVKELAVLCKRHRLGGWNWTMQAMKSLPARLYKCFVPRRAGSALFRFTIGNQGSRRRYTYRF